MTQLRELSQMWAMTPTIKSKEEKRKFNMCKRNYLKRINCRGGGK